jgi:selenocysteine-specific elongation factor
MKSVIVGTAGHIDHGKTSLVKALTGIDADRLEEEKRRGITIDIGFAHLTFGDFRFGFIDVPGHERFVRNMLAGIGGIDLVLLVIAADEGIKPQTREHFEICKLLNIRSGITVLTKSDTVNAESLAKVRREVEECLRESMLDAEDTPIIAVSSTTGAGLDELKEALVVAAGRVAAKDPNALFRLPIDRVFTMKGFGTVVTGTLVSGNVRKEDEVQVYPSGAYARVRGVQVHGAAAEQARAGERTALNLTGVAKEDLARGMSLAVPDCFRLTMRAHVQLTLLNDAKPLRENARVHFHAYASETVAQVTLFGAGELKPGTSGFAQLRFAAPMLLMPEDRFIIRQFSPVVTIGGGEVLDNAPVPKTTPEERTRLLEVLRTGDDAARLQARVARRGHRGLSAPDALAETGWLPARIDAASQALPRFGDTFITAAAFDAVASKTVHTVESFHEQSPLVAGISKEELRERLELTPSIFSGVLEHLVSGRKLEIENDLVRAAGRRIVMKDEEAGAKQTIEGAFLAAGLKVPALKDVIASLPIDKVRATKIVTLLLRDRVLIKLADELVFHRDTLAALRRTMSEYKAKSAKPRIDVTAFKDLTGVSRKYAIPLLEHLDRERVTRREGNDRIIL